MLSIPEVDWMGLALPFAYLLVLSVSLMTFSSIYRKRKASTCPLPSPHATCRETTVSMYSDRTAC